MRVFGKSDIGMRRHSNQDAFQTGSLTGNAVWAVVCDGMGGANGGNVASQAAVESIAGRITSSYREDMDPGAVKKMLVDSVCEANTIVYEKAQQNSDLSGMGTTVVLALVREASLYLAHAGDSRAYVVSEGTIRQVTTDHSMVQEMVERGELTQQQARWHPRKNIITRALGVAPDIKVDYCELPFHDEDILLLCSDGLSNYVDGEALYQYIVNNELSELADILVERTKELGGSDNITVVIVGR